MPRYEVDTVKQAATGRWSEIISSIGNVSADILDGQHHGCPKHCAPDAGGKDRFRALDDFRDSGAVFCNGCFSSRNGDGLAAVQWLLDEDFSKSLERVAKYLGIKAEPGRKKRSPSDDLDFLPWNRTMAHLWCKTKPPMQYQAVERLGAKYARYKKHYSVIALPVWGPQLDADEPVGWILYRTDGGLLPKYSSKKDAEPDWVKVKLTAGSQQGVVTALEDWKRLGTDNAPHTWWKVEGSTDLLTALSQDWPAGHAFFTTSNGAMEKPLDWVLKALEDTRVLVCHDADRPGQTGATWVEQGSKRRAGWCPLLAKKSREVRNVCLPFPIEASHGPDLRDFFQGGGKLQTLIQIAAGSDQWSPLDAAKEDAGKYAYDNAAYLADANLAYYRSNEHRDLVNWNGEWYRYKDTHYVKTEGREMKVRLRGFLQKFFLDGWKNGTDERSTVRNVTKAIIDNMIDAMAAQCELSKSVALDSWRNGDRHNECLAFRNCILDMRELLCEGTEPEDCKIDHSPSWFSQTCLPYNCDLSAGCPNWCEFINQVFDGDPESIEAVQRWFGYLLLPDTRLEKMMFIIGPTRSGKGTMTKVMINLFGRDTVASPMLSSMATDEYALHTLHGKTIAIIPDARLSKRGNNKDAATELILGLSSNDPMDVRRKYLDTLSGVKMNLRFTLFSNKLPELDDSTAAMAGRGIFLLMRHSFYGREDLGLLDRLLAELPGILNWSIVGRHNLLKEKNPRIIQPQSSAHLVRQMRMTIAPVSQFIRECTELHPASHGVLLNDLFERWCEWASDNAYVHRMDVTTFERKLVDAYPNLLTERVRNVLTGRKERRLIGLEYKESEEA